ncbi:MAG: hypothetical protein IJ087_15010, partial [Eggerthellaceae bacterium]|nr:hypothetical protein [Eggerthellaceae bacterium]
MGEARFTDVERQEYLDSLGQSEKGDGFSLKNEEITVTNGHEFSISGKITNETDRDCKYSLNWDVKDKSGTKIAEVFMTEPGNQMYLASVEVKAGETVSFSASGGGPVNTGVVRNTYTPD